MTPLRVLVVDDEPVAARRLATLVQRNAGIAASAIANGANAALHLSETFKPNLLLLDIEMPGLSGLDLAGQFESHEPPVIIFVTAFNQYAVDAFGVAAVDYLLKPVDAARLSEALNRARERLDAHRAGDDIRALKQAVAALRAKEAAPSDTFLWIGDGNARQRLAIDAIVWVEAERDYVRLHEALRSHLVRGGVGEILNRLPADQFVRLRRSALARLSAIERLERKGERSYFVVLFTGATIRIGRSYLSAIPTLLERLHAD